MRDLIGELDRAMEDFNRKVESGEYERAVKAENERRAAYNQRAAESAKGKLFAVKENGLTYRGFIDEPSVQKGQFRFFLLSGSNRFGPFYTKRLPR